MAWHSHGIQQQQKQVVCRTCTAGALSRVLLQTELRGKKEGGRSSTHPQVKMFARHDICQKLIANKCEN